MMNSSSRVPAGRVHVPVSVLMYREVGAAMGAQAPTTAEDRAYAEALAARDLESRIAAARAEGTAEAELRLEREQERVLRAEAERVRSALESFTQERKTYFERVESEVVHLAMAIAAKILHREAQVDRMLVAGLVRVAIEKLHDGSSVSVRVPVGEAERWRNVLTEPGNGSAVTVVEDATLAPDNCVLETDLGSASFGLDAQLKEVEQGFFDLLAQRPAIK